MKVTVETIADANGRMTEIADDEAIGDGHTRIAKMSELWGSIADPIVSIDLPSGMKPVFRQLDRGFAGFTHDNCLIAWRPKRSMPGTEITWRELVVIQSKREDPGRCCPAC